jgi:hypothetical protein
MGFIYTDITKKSTESGQYTVSIKGTCLGIIIKNDNSWLVTRPGETIYEDEEFLDKTAAAKHLAKLAGIDWQS